MTALAVVPLLMTAAWIGYLVGRRTAAQTPTWRRRTRRTALARQALELMTLVVASQIQRKVQRRIPARLHGPLAYAGHFTRLRR